MSRTALNERQRETYKRLGWLCAFSLLLSQVLTCIVIACWRGDACWAVGLVALGILCLYHMNDDARWLFNAANP